VHGVGGSGKRAGGKSFRARQLRLERLEERTVLSGGVVLTAVSGYRDSAYASFLDSSGNLVVAGCAQASVGEDTEFAALRYDDGVLDPTFGGDGIVTTSIGRQHDYAYAAAEYAGGGIVLGGMASLLRAGSWENDFALARYNADGTLDGTFGKSGKVQTNLGGDERGFRGLMVQPDDGKIVAVGATGSTPSWALVRYTTSG
jgi:uncharacterized delta-60 repeat protein